MPKSFRTTFASSGPLLHPTCFSSRLTSGGRCVDRHQVVRLPPRLRESARDVDTHELERLEQVRNEARGHGDTDALQALWAEDLEVDVPRMPVMTKSDVVGFSRSGRMKFLRYSTSNVRIRLYGDTPVITGQFQRTRVMNEKQLSDDWRFTKVYVREAQQSRVVSFHASEQASRDAFRR